MMKKPNWVRRYGVLLGRRSTVAMGLILAFGFIGGIVFWGGFNTVLEATNTEQFCIGCHEMKDNVYAEYTTSMHFSNRSGVRATCADCHVPHEWTDKIIRKVQAIRDIWGTLTGVVATPEKFEAYRLTMAKREWSRLRTDDSLACRNCHDQSYFNLVKQDFRSAYMHTHMKELGSYTCIDCHKGIAHTIPTFEGLEVLSPTVLVAEAEKDDRVVKQDRGGMIDEWWRNFFLECSWLLNHGHNLHCWICHHGSHWVFFAGTDWSWWGTVT